MSPQGAEMETDEHIFDGPEAAPVAKRSFSLMRGLLICALILASGLAIRAVVTTDPYWRLTELKEAPVQLETTSTTTSNAAVIDTNETWTISGAVQESAVPQPVGTEEDAPAEELAQAPATPTAEAPPSEALERALAFGERPKSDVTEAAAVDQAGDWDEAHIQAFLSNTAETQESTLELSAATRREVQRRLSLFGYDTNGIDGALGPNSRAAIMAWQTDYGFPRTGYLTGDVLASIRERTQVVWEEWELAQAEKAKTLRATKTAPKEPVLQRGTDGCLRSPDGMILPGQGFSCEFKRTKQQLADFLGGDVDDGKISVGRNEIER